MKSMSVEEMSTNGMYAGAGIALIPATATLLVACSKAILIDIVANVIFRVLTANAFRINIHGIALVEVPLLWKISTFAAIAGGSVFALSLTVFLINKLYQRQFAS